MKNAVIIIMSLALAAPMTATAQSEEEYRSYWRKVGNEIVYVGPRDDRSKRSKDARPKRLDPKSDEYRCAELEEQAACDRLESPDKKAQEGTQLDYRTLLDEDLRWLCDSAGNEDRQTACDEIARRAAD